MLTLTERRTIADQKSAAHPLPRDRVDLVRHPDGRIVVVEIHDPVPVLVTSNQDK